MSNELYQLDIVYGISLISVEVYYGSKHLNESQKGHDCTRTSKTIYTEYK